MCISLVLYSSGYTTYFVVRKRTPISETRSRRSGRACWPGNRKWRRHRTYRKKSIGLVLDLTSGLCMRSMARGSGIVAAAVLWEGGWCIVIKNIIRQTYPTAVVFNLGVLEDILHQSKWNRNHLKLKPALILALTKICPWIELLACQKQAQINRSEPR
jgi:hypothetical protein